MAEFFPAGGEILMENGNEDGTDENEKNVKSTSLGKPYS